MVWLMQMLYFVDKYCRYQIKKIVITKKIYSLKIKEYIFFIYTEIDVLRDFEFDMQHFSDDMNMLQFLRGEYHGRICSVFRLQNDDIPFF